MSPHLIEKKKYIVLKDVKKKKSKKSDPAVSNKTFLVKLKTKNKNNLLHKFQAWEEKKKSIPPPKS